MSGLKDEIFIVTMLLKPFRGRSDFPARHVRNVLHHGDAAKEPQLPTTAQKRITIVLNEDLTGFGSAGSITAAHRRVMKHYASPLLGGPPPSDDLLELVTHMYTENEADLVQHLPPLRPRTAEKVARISGRSLGDVRRVLESLASRKSIVLAMGTPRKYTILPVVPGTFEMAMMTPDLTTRNAWHKRFAEIFERIWETGFLKDYDRHSKAVLRYIPVGGVSDSLHRAWPAEKLEEILDSYDVFGVGNCQCRIIMQLNGDGCGRAMESCVAMGPLARGAIERGLARRTDREEVLEIKRDAEEQGCVTWLMNAIGDPRGDWSCSCCGCCCHMLRAVSEFNVPGLISKPHFMPKRSAGTCTLCGKCVEACPMGAWVVAGEDELKHARMRCIGCGLCALACEFDALELRTVEDASPPEGSYRSLLWKVAPGYLVNTVRVFAKRVFS